MTNLRADRATTSVFRPLLPTVSWSRSGKAIYTEFPASYPVLRNRIPRFQRITGRSLLGELSIGDILVVSPKSRQFPLKFCNLLRGITLGIASISRKSEISLDVRKRKFNLFSTIFGKRELVDSFKNTIINRTEARWYFHLSNSHESSRRALSETTPLINRRIGGWYSSHPACLE